MKSLNVLSIQPMDIKELKVITGGGYWGDLKDRIANNLITGGSCFGDFKNCIVNKGLSALKYVGEGLVRASEKRWEDRNI